MKKTLQEKKLQEEKKRKKLREEKGLLQLQYHKIIRILSFHKKDLNEEDVKKLIQRKNEIGKILKNKFEMK